ncbi:MFS transporter [Actinokineospora sp. NBRC 105648]|uniref:MFS transporter n=1 Tax=Actinokineospora sp. NBRC 105648 TaxID=3032206 RepID=UPI0024A30781|nr:MFS transporter [Actinokineospora sp. NBRC 105648]GLZ42790.1 MFS transporter [Actinokineospora sp. NBRC 105648]
MGLGRDFGWLWTAFAVSSAGSWLALDAFPLVAILVLHSSTTEVSILAAAGLALGALVAVPLGPWVEFRGKRPVMIGADLTRFLAILSVPAGYVAGWLTYAQLVVVSMVVAAANIVFTAASGSLLKSMVRGEDLLVASGRFEATTWTTTALGPPLGGAAIGLFGPVTTMLANSVSYLLSALGIRAIRTPEPARQVKRVSLGDVTAGWRYTVSDRYLRALFLNTTLVNGLILATAPLLAVLLLREYGFSPFEYGLAFGVPCVGGLVGARLARPLVSRFGQHRVLVVSGGLRACWLLGLAFVQAGQVWLVVLVEFGMITCIGVFNPVFSTCRLTRTPADRVARVLLAWNVSRGAVVAGLTVVWGVLGGVLGTQGALVAAGVLMLLTPALLWRLDTAAEASRES